MQQKRLLLALLISTAIIVIWTYLVPVKPPQPNNNSNTASNQQSPTPAAPSPSASVATPTPNVTTTASAPQAPRRNVVISTPLYETKIDTQGAEVVSWIIKKNKDSNADIYSVAGGKNNKIPLQLVSAEGLKRAPRQVPLQLMTGDSTLDAALVSGSYQVEGDTTTGDVQFQLAGQDSKKVSFLFKDPATGLDLVKTITFHGDRYEVELEISLKRYDQAVPQTKVRIGPSIGDQGVSHYTFYSVAPEGIAFVNAKPERHSAQSINENKNSPDSLTIHGSTDWAGVGDTYFAMVSVPARVVDGVEYRTVQYDHEVNGKKEKRYLISGFVPVASDGSKNVVYTGPKDHFILTDANAGVSATVGRQIDLDALIDYGWFSWLSRPLAVPILKAIKWLKNLTGNYGIAIILFTIVIYSLFFPLKWRSSKAMKKAQKLAPRMKELQDKMKGMKQTDPRLKELQIEQLKLMKEGNPLGGCLPLLIQMPFLFALYRAITISLDFRQATFLWLPDLSSGDPYHILEILMAGTMVVLQLITPAPSADPLQRKMMAIGMPIFMLYVLWGAPSGLLLYWLVGNIVGFSQQFLINRMTKSEDDEPPAPIAPKSNKAARKPKPSMA
jgi:YidC/Oxa1 family membrane protein insertase